MLASLKNYCSTRSFIRSLLIGSATLTLIACDRSDDTSGEQSNLPESVATPTPISTSSPKVTPVVQEVKDAPVLEPYRAPKAAIAPTIDGDIDTVWDSAEWQAIDVFWLGAQNEYPTAEDYRGRYKALWDEDQLYLLIDVTDDVIYDHTADPLQAYWNDDTVEIFIDENASGGNHQNDKFANAWAYHISTLQDVVDTIKGQAVLLNDHVTVSIKSEGTRHIWEMSMRIYGEDYNADSTTNTPLKLSAGKAMGFTACYIDNDASEASSGGVNRESMMGSVDTIGHKNNQGYINADVFGKMLLVE